MPCANSSNWKLDEMAAPRKVIIDSSEDSTAEAIVVVDKKL